MFRRILVLASALALCACASLGTAGTVGSVLLGGSTPPAIQAVGQTVVLDGSKALALAHLTYESVGDAALVGRRTHLIGDDSWAQVKAYDVTIYGYLSKGDAAKDSASKAAYASSALQAIDALKALVPASLFKK